MDVIFSVAPTDIAHTSTLSSLCAILSVTLAQPLSVRAAVGGAKMADFSLTTPDRKR